MRVLLIASVVLTAQLVAISKSSDHDGKRLIRIRPGEPAKWVTEEEMYKILSMEGFFDLTRHGKDTPSRLDRVGKNSEPYPTNASQKDIVAKVVKNVDTSRMHKLIDSMSKFHSRFYKTFHGTGSANEWLLSQVETLIKQYPGKAKVETMIGYMYKQKNIIARLDGSDDNLKSEIIILGAHQDSINHAGEDKRAPGADDNGSGVAVVFEVLRAIIENKIRFKRSLEFHWYSAEEIGIMGSDTVSESYRNASKNVIGMLNLDCMGYNEGSQKTIGIHTDDTDKSLTEFTQMIATTYVDYGWVHLHCNTYCSDHNRWYSQGYPTAYVTEVTTIPTIHSDQDTIDRITMDQVMQFAKLAVAFATELGGPYSS